MQIHSTKLLLLDPEAFSADLLQTELHHRGFVQHEHLESFAQFDPERTTAPDVLIFNYHAHQPQTIDQLRQLHALFPDVPVVALGSAGPAIKSLRELNKTQKLFNLLFEKPLSDERFFLVLSDLANTRAAARRQQSQIHQLSRIVPEPALTLMEADGKAQLLQTTVVFTDIRRSTELIVKTSPSEFFNVLNRSLSTQASLVEQCGGAVVKFTGDGVLAIFDGMGGSYLAARCAEELTRPHIQECLPFGIGVAQGLVLAGFIGDPHDTGRRKQYDVIGVTVHLASRLCGEADPGEVIAPAHFLKAAHFEPARQRPIGPITVRGFASPIECLAFQAAETSAIVYPSSHSSPALP